MRVDSPAPRPKIQDVVQLVERVLGEHEAVGADPTVLTKYIGE
jgi:hypothetical protein